MIPTPSSQPESFKVLGVRIDAVQITDVIARMEEWIATRAPARFICISNVHSVMTALEDACFRQVFAAADLSVPDGMPLVWVGRWRGFRNQRRVAGPDLFWEFCRRTQERGYAHYFYGGAEGVPETLATALLREFPSLRVAGTCSPPFRPLTPEEDARIVEAINQARPAVVWVGLGCPKQEQWMYEHRARLQVPVLIGVGQAFDVYAGRVRRAPRWMREFGLEWFFRLLQEPRRLWRRYLLYNVQFIGLLMLEAVGLRRYD